MTYLWPGVGPVEAIYPGVYRDAAGNIHFEVSHVLAYLGAEDTPANRELVVKQIVADTKALHP